MRDKIANRLRLLLIVPLMVGCSQTPEIQTEAPTPTESYLSEVRESQPELSEASDDTLFTAGETTCAVFDEGYSYEDALGVMMDSGLDARYGIPIIQAAATYLCPEHKDVVN